AIDHERLGYAVHTPVDRGAAVGVGADRRERIAVAADEAPRILRLVLVVDADDADALVLGELHQEWRLVVAGDAPRRPHIDQRHRALEVGRGDAGHRYT